MLGAAGGAELIATLLALSEGVLPPTIPPKDQDAACDLDYCAPCCPPETRELGLSVSWALAGTTGRWQSGGEHEPGAVKGDHPAV